jgi:hypothetical protein
VLGREVVERQQPFEVVAELVGSLGPARAELGVEALGRCHGMVAVLGVVDLGQHVLGGRLHRLGERFEHVGDLVDPVALLAGFGLHVALRHPEPERPVTDRHDRGPHPRTLEVAQQIGPRVCREFATASLPPSTNRWLRSMPDHGTSEVSHPVHLIER